MRSSRRTCHAVCDLLPFLRLAAYDVAFDRDGPVVLEFEARPGEDQVGFDRGVKSLFRRLTR